MASRAESIVSSRAELRDTLARRVKQLRLSFSMSQRDLAHDAGIRQALVSQIERGEANATLDTVLLIAMALGVGFADLFPPKETGSRPDPA